MKMRMPSFVRATTARPFSIAAIAMIVALSSSVRGVSQQWPSPSQPSQLTIERAAFLIAPIYDALNRPETKDVHALLTQTTAADYLSCGGNTADTCVNRETLATLLTERGQAIPDLKWQVVDLSVSGNKIIVRSQATGTPRGTFYGIAATGSPFHIMAIDIHEVFDNKIVRTHHIEDWIDAVSQVQGNTAQ